MELELISRENGYCDAVEMSENSSPCRWRSTNSEAHRRNNLGNVRAVQINVP
jgi:hypothetical protein